MAWLSSPWLICQIQCMGTAWLHWAMETCSTVAGRWCRVISRSDIGLRSDAFANTFVQLLIFGHEFGKSIAKIHWFYQNLTDLAFYQKNVSIFIDTKIFLQLFTELIPKNQQLNNGVYKSIWPQTNVIPRLRSHIGTSHKTTSGTRKPTCLWKDLATHAGGSLDLQGGNSMGYFEPTKVPNVGPKNCPK